MLALCRSGFLDVVPVVACGLIAWVVTNRLRKTAPVPAPSDYERLRRIYGTSPSVN